MLCIQQIWCSAMQSARLCRPMFETSRRFMLLWSMGIHLSLALGIEKGWAKDRWVLLFPVGAASATSWHEASDSTSGRYRARAFQGNYLMIIRKLKLMLCTKIDYWWQLEKSSNGVDGTVHYTCKLASTNLEKLVLVSGRSVQPGSTRFCIDDKYESIRYRGVRFTG